MVLTWKKLFYAFYCENIGCKLVVKVENFHIGVTWSLSISEADRAFQTTVKWPKILSLKGIDKRIRKLLIHSFSHCLPRVNFEIHILPNR